VLKVSIIRGRYFLPALSLVLLLVVVLIASAVAAPKADPIPLDRLPVLITSTSGDGRLRDVQVVSANVDRDRWLTELPVDPGVLLANNPAVSDSGSFMLVPSQGRSHGLWLTSGKKAKLVDMSHLGWPAAVGVADAFIWPVDPAVGDGRAQVQFLYFDAATGTKTPLSGSLIDDVEWVRGAALSPDKRWLLALVQRASARGKTDAVLIDLTGSNAARTISSSSNRADLVGPVSFAPDGSVVTFVVEEPENKAKNGKRVSQVFFDVNAASELARWPGAYSASWWNGRIWALRPGEKKNTELISAVSPSETPNAVKSLKQDLGDVRFISNAPSEIKDWPKSLATVSFKANPLVVALGGLVTFEGSANSREVPTHPVNATTAGWLQSKGADGKWQNLRYENEGRVTIAVNATGEYRWCSRIDFVLRDECSSPVTVTLN